MELEENNMIIGLRYLVLMCKDTNKSKQWYDKVGFEYLHGHEGMYFYKLGQSQLMLHPSEEEISPDSVSLHVNVSDVNELFQQVVDAGFEPVDHQQPGVTIKEPVNRPWGDVEFELRDPDGYRWAFTQS
jgi:uncharacterized glyoxalase superfamily protein PhnB